MNRILKTKTDVATMLMFWDYDTQWGADRSRIPGKKRDWGYREFENTDRLLVLHAEYEIPACFAVVGAAALPGERPYHDPQQIRRIHAAGHEIASHSFRHEWLPILSSSELLESLKCSKDALEQCIGAEVTSFVPPWNQPFDYPAGLSFSISERRAAAGRERTDLKALCTMLKETGYRFCRVAYRPVLQRIRERVLGRHVARPGVLEDICGVTCVRLNAPSGFRASSEYLLEQCIEHGGIATIWGHPHSLSMGNAQDEAWLTPFLRKAQRFCKEGRLKVVLPRDLTGGDTTADDMGGR